MQNLNAPHTPDTKNLIIALVIGTLIMGGWQYLYEQPRIEAHRAVAAQQEAEKAKQAKLAAPTQAPTVGAAQTTENASATRAEILSENQDARLPIHSAKLHGSLSLVGARIDDLTLAKYRETLDKNSAEVVLLSPSASADAYFAEFGWLAGDKKIDVPNNATRWQTDAKELVPETPVSLSWTNAQGVTFIKKITLDKDYLFTFEMSVKNTGKSAISLFPYGLIQRTYDDANHEHFAILHEGPLGVFNNTLADAKYKALKDDGPQNFESSTGWLGMTDKYWLSAIVPDKKSAFSAHMKHFSRAGLDAYQVDYRADAVTIGAGESATLTNHLFAGAKEVNVLDKYRDEQGFALFDRAVDFGMLYFLTKPIFHALNFIYGFVSNFGVAILILTVFIKMLMYPLANKSYTAMSQMKLLMPKIKELQELHKDDKMKMNGAMMEMYKKEKVNPMSGCLPILIQIPVFFALYKVLFVTIEMRHAPFFGWIQDLSAADPTNIFTLFGLLEYTPPSFLHIGIWPVIMCATMVIQQKLNPKPTDPIQAAVIGYMPYMFLFMFATFPAGLVVYWAWNNTLSIIQQRFIQYKLERKNAAKAKG